MMDLFGMGLSFAGAGALGYVATGRKNEQEEITLRLSLTKDGSFLTDVRLIGGVTALAAANLAKMSGDTKKVLNGIALVSGISLATTEGIRAKLQKDKQPGFAQGFEFAPKWGSKEKTGSYGAAGGKAYESRWTA